MSETKNDWKKTLNLPETPFPMKAQLNQKEPAILQKWDTSEIYRQILNHRKSRPLYILHDGPPYANGQIHPGTALNKILKDFVVKSKTMEGYQTPYVPGWDCHGLPIELKVDQLLGEKKAGMDIIAIREECRAYAEKFLDIQRKDFRRLGVLGDWENPYTTLNPDYEATIIRYFNSFVKKGNVYRRKRPVYWCISCQTALAEAEVEYHSHASPSIYVKFPLAGVPEFLRSYSDRPISILIWTTTPWTLPANLAIAVHPEFDYSLFRLGEEYMIAATRLIPVITDLAGATYEKVTEFKGTELKGIEAVHPLFPERRSLLITMDYVLLDQGTGCVHTAPGHGEEDFAAGLLYGLDIYSPVEGSGSFDQTAGKYAGQLVFEANEVIVRDLREKGLLLYSDRFEHSYPHCWRCKNPVIFRATEQWFIAMDKADLRKLSMEAIRKIQWLPSWGEERIFNMIENRPDWCISRQRNWGVPLPVFFCRECGEPLLDPGVIDRVADRFAKEGSNSWYQRNVEDFLPPDTHCSKCRKSKFVKGMDIVDVWFESGSSHGILDQYEGHQWPADLYLEGGDQYRGWFHSSLLVGISAKGESPYRMVISHGWVLNEEGQAMSKSLGNFVDPQEIIKEKGAEILRLWVSMMNYQEDVRLTKEILDRASESYRKIRNTWRFMLGVLHDFVPADHSLEGCPLSELDRYILHRFQQLKVKILEAYQKFEYYTVFHTLFNFFTVDLSSFYLNIQKDNLYCNATPSPARRASQAVVFTMLKESLQLFAPILVFTTEEAWEHLPAFPGKEASIHFSYFPGIDEQFTRGIDEEKWQTLMNWRDRLLKEIEEARNGRVIGDSLEAEILISLPSAEFPFLSQNAELLKELLIVSSLKIEAGEKEQIQVIKFSGKKCPRCWTWFPPETSESDLCPRCSHVIRESSPANQR